MAPHSSSLSVQMAYMRLEPNLAVASVQSGACFQLHKGEMVDASEIVIACEHDPDAVQQQQEAKQ